LFLLLHEARVLQHAQVLGDRRPADGIPSASRPTVEALPVRSCSNTARRVGRRGLQGAFVSHD
jgi:hypothetical protein